MTYNICYGERLEIIALAFGTYDIMVTFERFLGRLDANVWASKKNLVEKLESAVGTKAGFNPVYQALHQDYPQIKGFELPESNRCHESREKDEQKVEEFLRGIFPDITRAR